MLVLAAKGNLDRLSPHLSSLERALARFTLEVRERVSDPQHDFTFQ